MHLKRQKHLGINYLIILFMTTQREITTRIAQIGLTAKGFVYIAIGIMAFMAAFELGGQNANDATRSGAFEWLQATGGKLLLGLIAAGLICYVFWRFIQTFSSHNDTKVAKRITYFLSGLAYGSVAFTALKMIFNDQKSNGDQNQQLASDLMSRPLGEWLVIAAAMVFAGIGIYQLYYAWSKKYKDHLQKMNLHNDLSSILLRMGKIGYVARGFVWLLIAFLFTRAAIYNNSSEAGDTGKAFRFIEGEFMGSYMLGAIGLGLLAYGIFSITRARYEKF